MLLSFRRRGRGRAARVSIGFRQTPQGLSGNATELKQPYILYAPNMSPRSEIKCESIAVIRVWNSERTRKGSPPGTSCIQQSQDLIRTSGQNHNGLSESPRSGRKDRTRSTHGALRHTGEGAHPRPPSSGDTRVQPGVLTFVLSPTQKNKDYMIMGKCFLKNPEEKLS